MSIKGFAFFFLIVVCIAITIFIFQPGYMTSDAVDQLEQGRSGIFNDWHPPIMSWTWGVFDRILPGPLGMFLFQVILFWLGWGMLVRLAATSPLTSSVYLLAGFFPPVFLLLSTILKDVLMAAAFLLGLALLFYSKRTRSLIQFTLGLMFLAYGMSIRHNAILAALPLFLYAGWVFTKIKPNVMEPMQAFWRSIVAGSAFFIIFLLLGNIGNASLTKIHSHPLQQIMVHDLTGISLQLKTNLLPEYLASSEQPTLRDLRRIYQVRSMKNLYWPDFTPVHFRILYDPQQVSNLTDVWLTNVMEHPRAYLDHRFRVFTAILGIHAKKTCSAYYYEQTIYKPKGVYQNDGNYYSANTITDRLFTWAEPLRETPFYWNWLYVLSSLILFVVSLFVTLRDPQSENGLVALALSASGMFYGLAYFFVATACDFRMFLWNVIVTLLSLIFLIHTRSGQGISSSL